MQPKLEYNSTVAAIKKHDQNKVPEEKRKAKQAVNNALRYGHESTKRHVRTISSPLKGKH